MRVLAFLVAVVLCAPVAGEAQSVQRPTRPYRGLFGGGPSDPNQMRHELSLMSSLLGGYDQGVETGLGGPTSPSEGNIATTGDVSLNYFYGRTQRSFSADGRVFVTGYSNAGVDPLVGANVTLQGTTQIGRRSTFGASQNFEYSPNFVVGLYGILSPDVEGAELPDSGDFGGLVEQRSWASNTSVTIDRRLTTRQTIAGGYSYSQRKYLDEAGYDMASNTVDASYAWSLTRATSVRGSYNYGDTSYADPTLGEQGAAPTSNHAIEAGLSHSRRLSPTRQLHLSGGVGATYVETSSGPDAALLTYWTPSAHGTVRVDVGRTWAVGADYRRGATVVPGVTIESYSTDAISVRADGGVGDRIHTSVSFALSTGQSGSPEDPGTFRSSNASAQFRYALARCCSASVNYDYYQYTLDRVGLLPTGLPADYDRNSIRAGFTFWLPLYGNQGQAEPAGGRRR